MKPIRHNKLIYRCLFFLTVLYLCCWSQSYAQQQTQKEAKTNPSVPIVVNESKKYLPNNTLPQVVIVKPEDGALNCAGEIATGILCCEYELDSGDTCFDCDLNNGTHTNASGYTPACYHVVMGVK